MYMGRAHLCNIQPVVEVKRTQRSSVRFIREERINNADGGRAIPQLLSTTGGGRRVPPLLFPLGQLVFADVREELERLREAEAHLGMSDSCEEATDVARRWQRAAIRSGAGNNMARMAPHGFLVDGLSVHARIVNREP